MNPLISILIPAYNVEKWIKYSIKSALLQTWKNKEIIIVDDGSTDNTLKIAKRFESKYVKVVSQENKGASNARNRALSLSQGDFIQWLDADDLLSPKKIALQLKHSDKNPNTKILFSSSWGRCYYRPNKAVFDYDNPLCQDLSPVDWMMIHLGSIKMMAPCNWLVSRKLTDLAGNWDERLSFNDDGEYFSRVIFNSDYIKYVKEAKCYYRSINIKSLSRANSIIAIKSFFLSIELNINLFLKMIDNEESRKACINQLFYFIKRDEHNYEYKRKVKEIILRLGGNICDFDKCYRFSYKYNILKFICGKKTKLLIRNIDNIRIAINSNIDRILFILEKQNIKMKL